MPDTQPPRITAAAGAAVLVAVVTVAGSLWLSIGMHLKACPLCFYQRTFAMSVLAVMGVGLLAGVRPVSLLSLLSLPLAVGGLGVALFHVYLELSGKLECPAGVLGIGTAPQQSLAGMALLTAALAIDAVGRRKQISTGGGALVGGVVLGALLAAACVWSAPPMPPAPSQPYEAPLEICRPPYRPAS